MSGDSLVPAVEPASARSRRRRRHTIARQRQLLGVAFVAPAVLTIATFFLVPLGLMIWMSLNDWPLLGEHEFIAFDNYRRAVEDADFRRAFVFTLKYTAIVTPVLLALGLGLALLIRRPRRGVRFFQSIYFMPVVIGFASASFLWLFLAQSGRGPLPDLLSRVGLADATGNWFSGPNSALFVVIAMVAWKVTGMQMILLLAGLQSIPRELEEAAWMDGANRWQSFHRVVLPLLRPTLALVLVFSVAGSLLAFDQFYIMTAGGPSNQTITAVYEVYRTSFIKFELGYGAALSALLMIVLALVSATQLLLLRNTDHE